MTRGGPPCQTPPPSTAFPWSCVLLRTAPVEHEGGTLRASGARASVRLPSHARSPAPAASHGRDRGAAAGRAVARGARHPAGHRIGTYSELSHAKAVQFAAQRRLPLRVVALEDEAAGLAVPAVAAATRRPPCSACGTMKRHYFDAAALEGGFDVLVTGHNLDDEAARLMGNVLRWQKDHLARQRPVLPATRPRFVRKVKPLYLTSEYETAVYAFMRAEEAVVLIDRKERTYLRVLRRGRSISVRGAPLACDALIGLAEGSTVETASGEPLLVLRPTYAQLIPSLPRRAQPIYPKD